MKPETIDIQTTNIPAQVETLPNGQELINRAFNDIVSRIDELSEQSPELVDELSKTPLQKNTGMTDKPRAWR